MLSNVSGLHESVSGGCECPPAAQAIWVQKKADDIARHASVHLWPWSGGIATRRQARLQVAVGTFGGFMGLCNKTGAIWVLERSDIVAVFA